MQSRQQRLALTLAPICINQVFIPDTDWQRYGPGGQLFIDSCSVYSDDMNLDQIKAIGLNFSLCASPACAGPILYHYGRLGTARTMMNRVIPKLEQIALVGLPIDYPTLGIATQFVIGFFYLLGDKARGAALLRAFQLDWGQVDATWLRWTLPGSLWSNPGDPDTFAMHSGDFCVWQTKALLVLCDDENEEKARALLAELPDLETLYKYARPAGHPFSVAINVAQDTFLWFALACEKFDLADRAIEFADKVCSPELPGDPHVIPTYSSLAHSCRGRVLASRRQTGESIAAFEAAIEVARAYQLWMLEAFALRDMITYTLRPCGMEQDESKARTRLVTTFKQMSYASGFADLFPGFPELCNHNNCNQY